MKKIIIILLYLFCLASSVNAQNWLDSMKNLLASAKDDTTKFKLLSSLVLFYTYSIPDSAITYVQKEMLLARKMKSDFFLSAALIGYGSILSVKGNYSQAIYFELEGLKVGERSKNFNRIAWSYDYLTATYLDAGDYEHALFYCNKEKSLLESHYKLSPDSAEKIAIDIAYNSTMFGFAVV
ncbi:MAG TPA: hypothetical protein VN958_12670, partial [Chitinophagaceae bacterium]|nr:hypothetical protein [Chitinophagaceae bacterium]